MYTYKDVSYTDDQIKKAAEQSNMTVKEYLDCSAVSQSVKWYIKI